MLLCGLWHGAGWNFILWGGLHGLAIIAYRIWQTLGIARENLFKLFFKPFSYIITFFFVCGAWIFFRSESLEDSLSLFKRFLFLGQGGEQEISVYWLLFSIFVVAEYGLHVVFEKNKKDFLLPNWAYCIGIGALISVLLLFVPLEQRPFIYFQF